MADEHEGRHRSPADHSPADDSPADDVDGSTDAAGLPVPASLSADEGEPDIEAFAGDEETAGPNPPKDGEHGYGYE